MTPEAASPAVARRTGPTASQRRAADPRRSVWVAANAGTGKTRVLADRVLRLLLAGAHPESILCITFTRAAAAEMGERIERRLAAWAVERDEARLRGDLEELTGEPPDTRTLRLARRLFAHVLDLSHGLRIMTIHALCQTLLKRFPLEAEVAPHFETIDDRTAEELKAEARGIVLAERCREDEALGRAVDLLAVTLAESTLGGAITEMLGHRHRLAEAFARHCERGTCEGLLRHLDGLLEVEPGLEPPHLVERACADGVFDVEALQSAASAMHQRGTDAEKRRGFTALGWLNGTPAQRMAFLEDYKGVFLTREGTGLAKLLSKKLADDHLPALVAEQARLLRLHDRIRGVILSRRTAALLRLGHAVIDSYEGLKRRGALLDFDDLVERTRILLSTPGRKEWVLYKLDQRLDHVLVDEAQDTSPGQWGVVERLTEEFVAGAGARGDAPRTLFVVGDEKQSVYSFQGADLANFRAVRGRLLGHAEAAGLAFGSEALDVSFRTSRAVLEVVDRVLSLPEMAGAVTDPSAEPALHHTNRKHDPGLVELWPLADHADGSPDEPVAWPLPDRPRAADEPERRVAGAIAATLRRWLESGEVLEATGEPLRPADVLILVSRRGTVQEAIIRALKREGVPVAGADRLLLGEHIAVKDLVALGRAILLPEDDLTFAALLKSPLLSLSEDHLFALAWNRGRSSLLERLRERAESSEEPYAEAYATLADWLRRADFMPPFEFYCSVLSRPDARGRTGRYRLLERLGPDAQEPIEAFLSQALAYERGHPASLEGFLHWLGLGAQQLKRDPEQARDAVRVMTVHGAKGLEAPVVFLADAGPQGGRRGDKRLLWLDDWGVPVWRPRKEERDSRCEAAAEAETRRERDERLRLLYVALTRARDRLYVTGWRPKKGGKDETSWHAMVRRALAEAPDVERFELELGRSYRGEALRLRRGVPGTPAGRGAAGERPAAVTPQPLPPWATSPAAEETAAQPLAPSRLMSEEEPAPDSPAGVEARERIRHGFLVHRLLQVLPGLPAAGWEEAGSRLLGRLAGDLDESVLALLLAETLGVLRLPDLAPLFGPGSRPEQPVCGLVGGRMVAGQVDRLAVTADAVLIADYKTTRRPPTSLAGIPVAYLRQTAAYQSLLRDVYPGREVRAALVWTQGPRVTFLPPDLLDAQLRALHAAGADQPPA